LKNETRIYKVLTIAGSDSGGGAGIQADLKTFAASGVYGTSVITSITAQNTRGIFGIQNIRLDIVEKQLEAVLSDIGADAVKTGMLSTSDIIDVVARSLKKHRIRKLVVDPVMISKSGAHLLQRRDVQRLVMRLLPMAYVVTPNIPEAEVLTEMNITSTDEMEEACRKIHSMGCHAVVLKGGHLRGDPTDVFFDGRQFRHLKAKRIQTQNTHGTGCTFSAAVAAEIAKGCDSLEAVRRSKKFITKAIGASLDIGKGQGPVNPFHAYKP
jgi:hydroxymethylpyrimidine/phosphomethylpyrimidine kinase